MTHFPLSRIFLLSVIGFTAAVSLACRKDNLRDKHTESAEQGDIAKFLAGSAVPEASPLYARTQSPAYQRHQAYMLKMKEQIFTKHVQRIHDWQTANHFEPQPNTTVYLLSGADVPNLLTFFPDSRQYLMVALQPPAEIGDIAALTEPELGRSLERLRVAIQEIAKRNYFRSSVLRGAKKNTGMPGIAPILLTFMSLLNKEVVAFENVQLAADGTIQKMHPAETVQAPGFRIYFREPGDTTLRTLVYLSLRVEPDFHSPVKPEGKLLASFGRVNLILKAAIYLFHEPQYSELANGLLNQSDLVLQDDSGIPLHFFPQDEWKFALYGTYTRSARLTDMKRYRVQDDLRELYLHNAQPLSFSFGYGSWSGKSNMLWATRSKKSGR